MEIGNFNFTTPQRNDSIYDQLADWIQFLSEKDWIKCEF
jgi:hypothetical protein